jgi:hypothetical protein
MTMSVYGEFSGSDQLTVLVSRITDTVMKPCTDSGFPSSLRLP